MELSIALEKACYFPGELVKCLIKVRRLPDAAAAAAAAGGAGPPTGERLQLHYECSGSERVDPSWVGQLYHPEVTAQKDHKRLVRVIFSSGQVPLLEAGDSQALGSSGREFIVRCRLPHRAPPSYRGNAVRFVYQVVVRGSLALSSGAGGGGTTPQQQQQQQQQQFSCQAHSSFVVWPLPDRASLDRRPSLTAGPPGAAGTAAAAAAAAAGGAAGGGAAAPAGAPATPTHQQQQQAQQQQAQAPGPLLDGLQDVEVIEYRLGMTALKLRWEEVVVNPDGSRTLLPHTPSAALYPSSSTASQLTALTTAAQACALDALQLEDRQLLRVAAAAAAAGGGPGGGGGTAGVGGEDGDGDGGGGGGSWLRHLTPAQRASMSVRTFNLRAGEYPLLRLVLQPPTDGLLQPGGTFGLLLDFRASHGPALAAAPGTSLQPVCLQVVALLESEEVVLPPYAPARSAGGVTAMRKLHAEQSQLTAHLLAASFVFSIPLTAPPSFRTPMVGHKWVLRFELTLGVPRRNRPAEVATEQLLWALPLVVFPPPAQSGDMG